MSRPRLYGSEYTPSQFQAFNDYKLTVSRKTIRIVILALAIFNALLLLPDLWQIQSLSGRIATLALRCGFSLALAGVSLWLPRIRRFCVFAWVATAGELAAVAIFLFVLANYSQPDYMIQTLGVMVLTLAIFLFPNRWFNMLAVAILSAAAFLLLSYRGFTAVNPMQYAAAAVYIPITILLCAIFAYSADAHHFQEYTAHCELKRISVIDPLTQAANRSKLYDEGRRWMEFCRRHSLPLSLVYFDVDCLKIINDRFGHLVGDSVLVQMTQLIRSQLRSTDMLARWGGDEFILLLPNIPLRSAVNLSERIRSRIEAYPFVKGQAVTCSFGVVEMDHETSLDTMIQAADNLMYASKRQGKNTTQWQGADMG